MHGCEGFVAVCTDGMYAAATCAAAEGGTAEAGTKDTKVKSQLMAESVLDDLLRQYDDRFPEQLPKGLPPDVMQVIPYLWKLVQHHLIDGRTG